MFLSRLQLAAGSGGQRRWPFAIALVLTVLLVAPQLTEFVRSGGRSPAAFTDWDEPAYLPFSLAVSRQKLFPGRTGPDAGHLIDPLYTERPEIVTDIIAGGAANLLRLSPLAFGVILDLLIVPLAALIFYRFFLFLTDDRLGAAVTTGCMLSLPSLVSLGSLFPNEVIAGRFVSASLHDYPGLPVLRGVYTQVSYPLFGWMLLLLATALLEAEEGRAKRLQLLAGFAGGALIYVYFFSWLSAGLLLASATLALVILQRSIPIRLMAAYIASSAPGVLMLLRINRSGTNVPAEVFRRYFFFSSESFVLLVLCIGCIALSRRCRRSMLAWSAVACLAGEFIVANLQTLLGIGLLPYHVSSFYLRPLFTAVCIAGLFRCTAMLSSPPQRKAFRAVAAASFALAAVCLMCSRIASVRNARSWINEFLEVSETLRSASADGGSFMMVPFSNPFQPEAEQAHLLTPVWLSAVSGRPLFQNFYSFDPARRFIDEGLSGVLFTGKPQPVVACERYREVAPLRIFIGGDPFQLPVVQRTCARFKEAFPTSACEFTKDGLPEFLVRESADGLPEPPWGEVRRIWRSSSGAFMIYRVDRPALQRTLCPDQPGS